MNGVKGGNQQEENWMVSLTQWLQSTNTIYHAIYIKVFYDWTVSYLMVYTDDDLNTTNNETYFPELRRVSEEAFEIKPQERSVLKYLWSCTLQAH